MGGGEGGECEGRRGEGGGGEVASSLGWAEEDLGAAAVRRALRWVPPTRVRRRPFPASGLAGLAGPRSTWSQDTRSGRRDPAGSRRGRRGVVLPGHPRGVDDAAEQGGRPDGYPIDYDRAALERP